MDELDEKAFGSLGWPDIDEISDFWIHDKKILEFKIRNSESLLLGPVRHREVQLLQAAGLSATGRPSSRSKAAAFSELLFHKIRSNPWEASRSAPGMSRREWGSPPIVTYRKVEQLYLPEEIEETKEPGYFIDDISSSSAMLYDFTMP